jgi:hypothetical protein
MSAIDTLSSIRSADYHRRSRTSCNPCEVCGREIKDEHGLYVETEQGDYPIGSTCATKARKAGLVVTS